MTQTSRQRLGLAAAAIALLALIAWWGSNASIGYRSQLRCCVFDPGTGGAQGLTLWARQLGFPTRPLEDPLWEAVGRQEFKQGNCFLTAGDGTWSPWDEELSQERWNAIHRWISRGNTLIVLTTAPSELPSVFRDDVLGSPLQSYRAPPGHWARNSEGGEEAWPLERSVTDEPQTSVVSLPDHQSLTVRADGPRWAKVGAHAVTAADGLGIVWLRQEIGAGAVYVLLDDFAWTNSGFDSAGNAEALAALLNRELHGGVLGFDEYRHGHGRVESFAGFLLALPGAGVFCLIAAALAAIYLAGRNVRFGRLLPFEVVERRSAREYVEAAAFLNQRARAAPLAVESIVRRIRSISRRRGTTNAELQELLPQGERFVASGARPANPAQACALVRQLVAQRKKLYGS
jgi:hypothetical protein